VENNKNKIELLTMLLS